MYLFSKVVFLAVLFLPWYKGAHYIYRSHLREVFRVYEGILYNFSLSVMEKIREEIFIEKPKEQKFLSSDEEVPGDSTPEDSDSDNEDNNEDEDEKNEKAKNIKTFVSKNTSKKYFKK